MIQEAQIWLAMVQQADGQRKRRPIIVLKKMPNNDFLVCSISTQLRHEIIGFDMFLEANSQNGLNTNSIARLSLIATLAENEFYGMTGTISNEQHQILLERLSNYLQK